MQMDKKFRDGKNVFVLPTQIGAWQQRENVDWALVHDAVRSVLVPCRGGSVRRTSCLSHHPEMTRCAEQMEAASAAQRAASTARDAPLLQHGVPLVEVRLLRGEELVGGIEDLDAT